MGCVVRYEVNPVPELELMANSNCGIGMAYLKKKWNWN